MSKFDNLKKELERYLNSPNSNLNKLYLLFENDQRGVLDAYLSQNKYSIPFLKYVSQKSPDLLKNKIKEFLAESKHIKPFLLNQELYTFLEWAINETQIIYYVKHSSLVTHQEWKTKWSKQLKNSHQQLIKDFCKEAAFLNDYYLQNKSKAQETLWLQEIAWQDFLSLITYQLHLITQGNPVKNLIFSEALFFMVQHKKEGNTTFDQQQFENITDQWIEKELVQLNLFAIPKKNALEKFGYDEFQKTLKNYTEYLDAKGLLEKYCFSDNVAVHFLTDQVGRVYFKSVKKGVDYEKDTLKYSYCSRFYNEDKDTFFEHSFSAQTIKNYFIDFGFDINQQILLKENKKISIDLIAEICEALRNWEVVKTPYIILNKEFLSEWFVERNWNEQYTLTEFEDTFNLLATQLPFQGKHDTAELFKIPIFSIKGYYLWFPKLMLSTDFLTGLLNKIWENLEERKIVANNQSVILKELLENHGFKIFANHHFNLDNSPEFDLIAFKNGLLFIFELKTTNFRNSEKGIYLHYKEALPKSGEQLRKGWNFVYENQESFESIFDNQKINEIKAISVSTSFDYDHYGFFAGDQLFAYKMSFFELLIILRNERHKLFDKNLILEKVNRLLETEPILEHFDLQKIDKIAEEYLLYELGELLSGQDLSNLIYLDTIWGYWMSDQWNLLDGGYISVDKNLKTIFLDSFPDEISNFYNQYNQMINSISSYKPEEIIQICDRLLEYDSLNTGILFEKGKALLELNNFQEAINVFERTFDIDFAEGAGLNPFENKAFDWLIQAYRLTNQIDKARILADKCSRYPECYISLLALAELELEIGDKDKARMYYTIYRNNIPKSDYPSRLKDAIILEDKFGMK